MGNQNVKNNEDNQAVSEFFVVCKRFYLLEQEAEVNLCLGCGVGAVLEEPALLLG